MNTIEIELTETTATLPKELFLEILKENERLKDTCEKWAKDYYRSEESCSRLLSERRELTEWKSEASDLFDALKLQEIGKELGLPLGTDIAPQILPGIQKLNDRTATLECENRDYRNLLRQINHLSE